MRKIDEPTLDPGKNILQALDSAGKTIIVGSTVKLTCHSRPEFFEGGQYRVDGLFTHTDTSLGQNRKVATAKLMKISQDGSLLDWSWKTRKWQVFVDFGEPAIYAETNLLEKIEKEGISLERTV